MRLAFFSFLGGLCLLSTPLSGQVDSSYVAEILQHRQDYARDLIEGERAPLRARDTAYLDFFPPDPAYKVLADFTSTPEAEPFEMPTSSGRTKTFVQYGWLHFSLAADTFRLAVYRNLMLTMDIYKKHLFLPFKDGSSGESTYGGGRYLDLSMENIQDGKIILNFNLAYNPYCAFSNGYNCPIPPSVNRLDVAIEAGEKAFTKDH
ncbi:MAG: DUF1684 domain-containing protein [Saprospirales bacterium]|nr:DUF1684 domain-containing protein [Saprospirales bacterium]